MERKVAGFFNWVTRRLERRREAIKQDREFLLKESEELWSYFGGFDGYSVDEPGIIRILQVDSHLMTYNAKVLYEDLLQQGADKQILRVFHKEWEDQWDRRLSMSNLHTQDGNLEAIAFFANRRLELQGFVPTSEITRRIVAYKAAVNFLMSSDFQLTNSPA